MGVGSGEPACFPAAESVCVVWHGAESPSAWCCGCPTACMLLCACPVAVPLLLLQTLLQLSFAHRRSCGSGRRNLLRSERHGGSRPRSSSLRRGRPQLHRRQRRRKPRRRCAWVAARVCGVPKRSAWLSVGPCGWSPTRSCKHTLAGTAAWHSLHMQAPLPARFMNRPCCALPPTLQVLWTLLRCGRRITCVLSPLTAVPANAPAGAGRD